MKKKIRLRKWVKITLAGIIVAGVLAGGLTILSMRYNQLCKNGYDRYCLIEGGSK